MNTLRKILEDSLKTFKYMQEFKTQDGRSLDKYTEKRKKTTQQHQTCSVMHLYTKEKGYCDRCALDVTSDGTLNMTLKEYRKSLDTTRLPSCCVGVSSRQQERDATEHQHQLLYPIVSKEQTHNYLPFIMPFILFNLIHLDMIQVLILLA